MLLLSVLIVVSTSNRFSVKALSPLEAIETYKADIVSSARKTGVWASVTAAQLILESGNPMSDLATKDNNFFGIKWSSNHAKKYPGAYAVNYSTLEDYGSGMTRINDDFTHFPTPKDGITEHSIIWWNGNYGPELNILKDLNSTMDEFLKEMGIGPYATDPNYYSKLRKIIDDNKLEELDKQAFPEGRKFCGFGDDNVGEYKYPDDGFNDVGTSGSKSVDVSGKGYVIVDEKDLVGMYPESFFGDDAKDISLATYDELSTLEKANLDNIKRNILQQREWSIYDTIRVLTVFMGLCLIFYSVLIFVAYIFDRTNNLIEVSMISILSLGSLCFSDDEDKDKNWHHVNKSRLLKIEISLWLVGFFLVAGGVFNLVLKIAQFRIFS